MNSLSPTPIQDELPPAPIVVSAAIPSVGTERTELSEESDAERADELTFGGDWARALMRERLYG